MKVLFVDRFQQEDHRPLRHFILKRRDTQRTLPSIAFRNIMPSHRRRLIASGLQSFQKIIQISVQIDGVVSGGLTINSYRTVLAGQLVGIEQPFVIQIMI